MQYLLTHLDNAWTLTLIHLRLSLVPIVLGLLIAVPLGALVQRTTVLRRVSTVTASIIFTIPSLALFVALPSIIGTSLQSPVNVIISLTIYGLALMVRSTVDGLTSVDAGTKAASTASSVCRSPNHRAASTPQQPASWSSQKLMNQKKLQSTRPI